MDRRKFVSMSGASAAGLLAAENIAAPAAQAQSRAGESGRLPALKVKLGHELGQLTDKNLNYVSRFGVQWIGATPKIADPSRIYATVDELNAMRELAEKHGLHVELINSVLLNSSNIDREQHPAIMLAQSPERDRDIETFQNLIKNCAGAGIPTLKYNMSILGVVRSGTVQGRGDAIYNKWNYEEAMQQNLPNTKAGVVNAEAFWERIDYFLSHVVPVANEYKVNIACHPQDPGMPQPQGYRGVDRVLGTVDGLKKFVGMHESPHHGLNFCQGTVSEDLEDPNAQIGDVVRWFGSRKKIFNVHFRNIRGHRGDFVAEMFPDEGDVDFVKVLKVYREVGYDKILMPDHAPRVPGDTDAANENFAFEFGYIRGLIQAEQHLT
jgi:mannonate dehydratase